MNLFQQFLGKWKSDFDFKTLIGASGALSVTVLFAFYNGFLGIHHASLWHGTICVYYLLLSVLRGLIVVSEKRLSSRQDPDRSRDRVSVAAATLLLILNLSLIVPLSLLVRQEKPVDLTLIPAIAMAAYTTYKITMASVNLRRRRASSNVLVKLLRTIGFIDALVSILTLQNTLIMVQARSDIDAMLPLTASTSGAIWVVILFLSVFILVKGIRNAKQSGKE